ncbi:hypothetical protein M6B38_357345 [Iris pallida]|uniref:Uncharacterized protein n=1 Tax=Iris pallida TaxID=29817 RepID=A0AAX6GL98_IRIPA|nr:hypothetical protein M6B38_357340 [Iris pallida]KAJ6829560.1 hypothetical protein M6B38_357345 [Iris pallida]
MLFASCLMMYAPLRSTFVGSFPENAPRVLAPTLEGVDGDLAPMNPASPWGPPMTKRSEGSRWKMVFPSWYLVGTTGLIQRDLVIGDDFVMLGGDEDGVDAYRYHGVVIIAVIDVDLGLAVGPEPGAGAVLAGLDEPGIELGREDVGEGHGLNLMNSFAE